MLGVVFLCSLGFGTLWVPLSEVVRAFTDFDGSNAHLAVRDLRWQRTVTGVAVGAALGAAGAVMQGISRNPLAEPGILGVEAGAALAVVLSIRFLDPSGPGAYTPYALAGAGIACVAVYAIGSAGRGGATPVKLALSGAAMSALITSFTSAVLLSDTRTLDEFRFWMVGSLLRDVGDTAYGVFPLLAFGGVLAIALSRSLNSLALGDDVALSLGMRVHRTRLLAALAIASLTGGAVAAAGPIAFVGLAVPHVARAIAGPDYRWVLPWSMVLGPILLLSADVIGRMVVRPSELQVGLVTAVLGGPFFIFLIRRRRLAEL